MIDHTESAHGLSDALIRDLETLSRERQKALILWYLRGQAELETSSGTLNALLGAVHDLDARSCYDLLVHLDIKDMVRFTVLNELGPLAADKPWLDGLVRQVSKRLVQGEPA